MTPSSGTPSDWLSGERVFAPPRGTVDLDWLVPAVVELVPGATPGQARTALEHAWRRRRAAAGQVRPPPAPDPAAPGVGPADSPDQQPTPGLTAAADRVLAEAVTTFGD